jgi:hypothetical protein
MLLSSEGFVEGGVVRHWFGSEIKVCHRRWITQQDEMRRECHSFFPPSFDYPAEE